jgi:hypothetical protein
MEKNILERNQRAIDGIKSRLAEFLEYCDDDRTPYVCKARQTKEGYAMIEEYVLKSVVYNDKGIMEAVMNYETLLNPNGYID